MTRSTRLPVSTSWQLFPCQADLRSATYGCVVCRDISGDPGESKSEEGMSDDQQGAEWNVADWHGKTLVDAEGEKIGKLQDVYVDV